VPGFNHTGCAEACAQHGANGTGVPRCLQLCDAARCPHGNGTYENCTSVCALTAAITGGATGGGTASSHTSNYERSMCEQRCRIHCPPSGAADVATWPAPVADNFWAANLEVRDCS